MEYREALTAQALPFFERFSPDLLIVSAGYDANSADPIAGMNLEPADYEMLTELVLRLQCPILFGLEGGYDCDSLARSVVATIEACLGKVQVR